ncbi:hypothetical protein F750_2956 [Streptomyces sp. PAMC 26508]|nr:hypothetical protein F750_2956 [Streptomyces sp. PAMC 26508]
MSLAPAPGAPGTPGAGEEAAAGPGTEDPGGGACGSSPGTTAVGGN